MERSNKIAASFTLGRLTRWFPSHGFNFFLHDCPNGLIKYFLKSNTSKSTTFQILAFIFFFKNLFSLINLNRGSLHIFTGCSIIIPHIYFISHKNNRGISCGFSQLWIPLNNYWFTNLRAFVKVDGSMTEKMIRKTSVFP